MTSTAASGPTSAGPTVIVGFDDRPGTGHVLETAADLTQRLSGSLVVVHALPALPLPPLAAGGEVAAGAAYAVPPDPRETAVLSDSARTRAAQHLDPTGIPWRWVCEQAHPEDLIVQQAEQEGAYLIVVGAAERGLGAAVEHAVVGSTSKELGRITRWPLLHVPPPTRGDGATD